VASRSVRFYFDYVSPNAYLAWTQLPALAARHEVTIEPVPVLFAGLLEAHGQLGPAEVAPKMRWMFRNVVRKAALLRVPLHPPAFHPFNPLLALRVSLLALDPAARWRLVGALFEGVWVRGLHVSEAPVVVALADQAGLAGAELLAQASAPEAKARLRAQTDDAAGRGVFGVPTMEVGGELFWGYDDFPQIERALAGTDPLTPAVWSGWSTLPRPSATRAGR
jgi:2-hydroxychromene-2-carboxylate isomerase